MTLKWVEGIQWNHMAAAAAAEVAAVYQAHENIPLYLAFED